MGNDDRETVCDGPADRNVLVGKGDRGGCRRLAHIARQATVWLENPPGPARGQIVAGSGIAGTQIGLILRRPLRQIPLDVGLDGIVTVGGRAFRGDAKRGLAVPSVLGERDLRVVPGLPGDTAKHAPAA